MVQNLLYKVKIMLLGRPIRVERFFLKKSETLRRVKFRLNLRFATCTSPYKLFSRNHQELPTTTRAGERPSVLTPGTARQESPHF